MKWLSQLCYKSWSRLNLTLCQTHNFHAWHYSSRNTLTHQTNHLHHYKPCFLWDGENSAFTTLAIITDQNKAGLVHLYTYKRGGQPQAGDTNAQLYRYKLRLRMNINSFYEYISMTSAHTFLITPAITALQRRNFRRLSVTSVARSHLHVVD